MKDKCPDCGAEVRTEYPDDHKNEVEFECNSGKFRDGRSWWGMKCKDRQIAQIKAERDDLDSVISEKYYGIYEHEETGLRLTVYKSVHKEHYETVDGQKVEIVAKIEFKTGAGQPVISFGEDDMSDIWSVTVPTRIGILKLFRVY